MEDIVLSVKDIHLSYKFYKAKALRHFILDRKKRGVEVFEALKGVSFDVQRGTNVGIIGSNGSGKSTLLRTLAHTLTPDKGVIVNKAKSVSLLSLGVGFKPDLSGRENIFLNGLLLGLSRKEIEDKMQDIISFSEIGDFIANPVRTYSSGMKSRLSFSIAINVDPDLMLIDELFSVGDEKFKKKSSERMKSMIKDHRTVVMVSHSMKLVAEYCDHVLWLDHGAVKMHGKPEIVINEYMKANT